jgi:hypothetical protein
MIGGGRSIREKGEMKGVEGIREKGENRKGKG